MAKEAVDGAVRVQKQHRLLHTASLASLVYVSVKVGLPLLGKVGGLLFGRKGGKGATLPVVAPKREVDTQPSEDKWQVLTAPAPPIPDDLKEIFSCSLPCSVQDFYSWFVAGSSDFVKKLHIQLEKREDYDIGSWHTAPAGEAAPGSPCNPADGSVLAASGRSPFDFVLAAGPGSGGYIRNVTFVQPKKGAQNVDAQVVQRQQFAVYEGEVLVLATAQNMLNIPFKDCFTVNTCWVVKPAASGCTFTSHLKVNFVKGCFVGGIIKMTTTNSNIQYFKSFGEMAARTLAAGGPPPTLQPAASSRPAAAPAAPARPSLPSPDEADEGLQLISMTQRQLKVALLVLLLLLGLVHQLVLSRELHMVRRALDCHLSPKTGA